VFRTQYRESDSLIPPKLFPVLFRFPWAHDGHKWCGFCGLSEELSSGHRRKFCDFPVDFPVCREMQQESGSL
jgi:hypothetical protein